MEEEKIIGNIDHIAIAVRSIEGAQEFFSDLLDTEFTELAPSGPGNDEDTLREAQKMIGFRSVISPEGIELMESTRPDSDLQKFLDKRGEGVYAVAFTVEDAGKARAKAEKKGIRIAGEISSELKGVGPMREIWLHPKDCHGVYIMFTEGLPFHP
jgi:methylmalonyl-CoA/ethylmalonyl-CoA epimerase